MEMDIMEVFEQQRQRERQVKLNRFKQLNQYALPGQILFAGSSLAEQFPIDELKMRLNPVPVIYNRGIGGDTMSDLEADLDTLIIELKPRVLFINIGSNDLNLPTYNENELVSRYKKILLRIIEKLPQIKIYVLSYYPVNPQAAKDIPAEYAAGMFSTRNNKNINSINKKLQLMAEKLSKEVAAVVAYIDVNTCLLDGNEQLDPELTVEGIHLWPEAYVRVLDVLKAYLACE
jgi:lysophospholipase L1-like esterase